MSQNRSKFETILEEAREESYPVPSAVRADVLALLRKGDSHAAKRRHPFLLVFPVAAITLLAFLLAMPRPSAASRLLAVLDFQPKGVVHQKIETVWKGEKSSMDVFFAGDIARAVHSDGTESRFEKGRSLNRQPQGYLTIEHGRSNASSYRPPSIKSLLEQSKDAKIERYLRETGEVFRVQGKHVDGQGILRTYFVELHADNRGRPISETIEHEGLGKTEIKIDYDVDPANLELTPVASDRVYDLSEQRSKLLQLLAARSRASNKEEILRAYLDETGVLGVLVAIPRAVEAQGDRLKINGAQMELAGSSFNRYVGLTDTYVHAPVEYNGQYLFLKKAKVKEAPKTPFRLEFPLWQYDPAFKSQQPFLRLNTPGSPRLIRMGSVEVKEIERTSSVTRLLTPMNIPFFLDKNFQVPAAKKR